MFLFKFLNSINNYGYSAFNEMKFLFEEVHKDPRDFHMIAIIYLDSKKIF